MIFQIHHQHKKEPKTKMVAQFVVEEGQKYNDIFRPIFAEIQKTHPLKSLDWQWMICNENSEWFIFGVEKP